MTKRAMNMHTSQISHGYVPAADFVLDGDNTVVVGYTPAMVKIMPLSGAGEPLAFSHWYAVSSDAMFWFNAAAESQVDAFIETNERGFVLDGAALVAKEAQSVAFMYETYGCEYKSSGANAAAVAADTSMPFIDDADDDEYEDVAGAT